MTLFVLATESKTAVTSVVDQEAAKQQVETKPGVSAISTPDSDVPVADIPTTISKPDSDVPVSDVPTADTKKPLVTKPSTSDVPAAD